MSDIFALFIAIIHETV